MSLYCRLFGHQEKRYHSPESDYWAAKCIRCGDWYDDANRTIDADKRTLDTDND